VSTALSLGTLWLVAKFLPVESRGQLVTVVVWTTVLASIGSLSVGKAAYRRSGMSCPDDDGWLPSCLGASVLFCAVGGLIAALLSLYILQDRATGEISSIDRILAVLLIFSQVASIAKTEILLACGLLRTRSTSIALDALTCFIATIILVGLFDTAVAGALGAKVLGSTVGAIFGVRELWLSSNRTVSFHANDLKNWFADSLKVHPSAVGNLVRSRVDILMLAYYVEKAEVSVYELALRLVDMIMMLPNTASAALLGQLNENNIDQLWFTQKKIMARVLVIVIGVTAIAYFAVPHLILIAFGPDYALSGTYFQFLAPILIGKTFGGLMSSQILGRGYLVQASLIGIGTTALNIFLNWKWIPIHGTMGAIYATLIAYAVLPLIFNTAYWFRINRDSRFGRQA